MEYNRAVEINKALTYDTAFLDTCREAGDAAADLFITETFNDPATKAELYTWLSTLKGNAQLSSVAESANHHQFFEQVNQLPDWADTRLMKKGAAFFSLHTQQIMSMLGLLSLPYCYTAANGAMVLYLSDRLRNDVPKRLKETAEFVWDVMAPGAFEGYGSGFSSILKVRLMHAAGRYYTLNSGHWNMAWGLPINQEDMAGTNLSFSIIVIRGLRKFGYTIAYEEQQAFMHLWNVIGYLLGIQKALLPDNGKQALLLEQAIRIRQFRVSEYGRALTASLTNYLVEASKNSPYAGQEVLQLMRYLLGDEIADTLALPPAKLPESKVRLLKLINFVQELKLPQSAQTNYNIGYQNFKRQASTN